MMILCEGLARGKIMLRQLDQIMVQYSAVLEDREMETLNILVWEGRGAGQVAVNKLPPYKNCVIVKHAQRVEKLLKSKYKMVKI